MKTCKKCHGTGKRLVKSCTGYRETFCECEAGAARRANADGEPTKHPNFHTRQRFAITR